MALLIAPILFIAAAIYIAYPLLKEKQEDRGEEIEKTERQRLMEAKEEVISNLKDIEMDYRMGKLSQDDYQNLKLDFEHQAMKVFQQLESLEESRKGRKKQS